MDDRTAREAVLAAALPHAAFDGFTDKVLQKAGQEAGADKAALARLFPEGPLSLIEVYSQSADAQMEKRLAAMDLGASPLKVFFVITLPIIFPAILSGWLLAFTLSWDDLVISSFTSGPGSSTLPMVVFSKVRLGVSPEINVLATITITVVTLMIVGVSLWMSRMAKLDKTGA